MKNMRSQPRWFLPAILPIVAGVAWLSIGWRAGIGFGLLASLPGGLLLATGVALLVWPGDRQISHYMALGGVLGVLIGLPALFLAGPIAGGLLLILTASGYLVAGYAALFQNFLIDGLPEPKPTWRMARKVALDEAILAYFVASARVPTGREVETDAREIEAARGTIAERGWADDPAAYHQTPPVPESARLKPLKAGGQRFEHLSFDSGYQPHEALPGGERWQGHEANRRMHAWVFRHDDGPRPWLMCIHGYRMGIPWLDFSLFDIETLHRRLGLNLVMPILPLHGPRKAYLRSGSGFLDGNMVELLHAETQAAWDLRRTLAWLRADQKPAGIGVLGYSLGGYNAALLSGLDGDLDCVVAGIPLTDITEVVWRHLPTLHLRYVESRGIHPAQVRELLAPVSPFALPPQVPLDRRYIFAAAGDQLVPPEQALRLWRHWQEPEICWYQGSHLSVRRERTVARFIHTALTDSGLAHTADKAAPEVA